MSEEVSWVHLIDTFIQVPWTAPLRILQMVTANVGSTLAVKGTGLVAEG